MSDNRSLRQFLQLLASSGVTCLPKVTLPVVSTRPKPRAGQRPNAKSRATTASTAAEASAPRRTSPAVSLRPGSATPPPQLELTRTLMQQQQTDHARKTEALNQLACAVSECQRCSELAEARRQTVFGVGNPSAEIMFIGEAPGADEDRQGEPFVGAAGQLLNKIIEACGLKREDLYICNILRCRPPGNRNPLPQEAANCREFLDGQIHIIQPRYIVCWGTVAAQNLLGETRSVGKLRGQFLQHGDAKVLCTYHPSYLLRNPSAKKLVWEDMKLFMNELGISPG